MLSQRILSLYSKSIIRTSSSSLNIVTRFHALNIVGHRCTYSTKNDDDSSKETVEDKKEMPKFIRRRKLTREEMADELLGGDFVDPETERDYGEPNQKKPEDDLFKADELQERLAEIKQSGIKEYDLMDIQPASLS